MGNHKKVAVGTLAEQETIEQVVDQLPALESYETDAIPESYSGVRELVIKSNRKFTAYLDGVRRKINGSLRITHPKPLTVYEIKGMRSVSYLAPGNSRFPNTDAREVTLTPKDGALAVTSYETVPEDGLLESRQTTGKTVYRRIYLDPRVVELDGKNFPNVKTVRIEGLRDAEIKLYMQ
ncbi:MAG: hypothetical protein HYW23_02025 [Candidatus Aenigmarchaeota archaeon]|nr:hypothetical protein [Candidatus Aenigmarchaeota archaeon]